MDMLQEELKNVPEDKRAMVEQMIRQQMPNPGFPIQSSGELTKTRKQGKKQLPLRQVRGPVRRPLGPITLGNRLG